MITKNLVLKIQNHIVNHKSKLVKSNPVHYDETSKYGRKTGSVQVRAGGRPYTVGLSDKDIGTAERLFDSIKIGKNCRYLTEIKKVDQLSKMLLNLKNTMIVRHSVNDVLII